MAKWALVTVVLLPLCMAAEGPAAAEGNWDSLRQLQPGDKIRVHVRGKGPVTGSFGAVTPQTLQVVGNNRQQMDFTPAQVQRVDRVLKRSSMWAAAPLVGAAGGLGAGFGIGWGAAASENSKRAFDVYSPYRAGILGAVLGAPAGALIGYKVRGPGHSVVYRAQ